MHQFLYGIHINIRRASLKAYERKHHSIAFLQMGDVRVYDKSAKHSAFIIALDGDNLLHNTDIGSIFLSDPVIIATFVFHDLIRRKLLPELGDSGLKFDEMRKIDRKSTRLRYSHQ